MKKAIIYMEVACGCCGGIINRDYHNSKSVKWLKNATKLLEMDKRIWKYLSRLLNKDEMTISSEIKINI